MFAGTVKCYVRVWNSNKIKFDIEENEQIF